MTLLRLDGIFRNQANRINTVNSHTNAILLSIRTFGCGNLFRRTKNRFTRSPVITTTHYHTTVSRSRNGLNNIFVRVPKYLQSEFYTEPAYGQRLTKFFEYHHPRPVRHVLRRNDTFFCVARRIDFVAEVHVMGLVSENFLRRENCYTNAQSFINTAHIHAIILFSRNSVAKSSTCVRCPFLSDIYVSPSFYY